MNYSLVGIILAGGQSRRFGSPKAFALKDGVPFYQYSIDVMKPFAESIILVSNNDIVDRFLIDDPYIEIMTDYPKYTGLGPLAGIYSGMESMDSEWYLISPIDVPFMNESVYERLIQKREVGKEAIVPIVRGRLQPLISVFHQSMKEKIKEQLERNELSLQKLFARSKVSYIDMDDEKSFRNINYQEDLFRYMQEKDI